MLLLYDIYYYMTRLSQAWRFWICSSPGVKRKQENSFPFNRGKQLIYVHMCYLQHTQSLLFAFLPFRSGDSLFFAWSSFHTFRGFQCLEPVNADRWEQCFFMLWFHIRLATNKKIIIPILSLICPQQQSGGQGLIHNFVAYNYLSKYLFDIYNPMSDTFSRRPAIASEREQTRKCQQPDVA